MKCSDFEDFLGVASESLWDECKGERILRKEK
jgi:hypothetical protein